MSYSEDLKAAIAGELDCDPDDLIDVEVRWDDGDRWDSMEGSSTSTPSFAVWVTQLGQPYPVQLDTSFTFTQLLRMVLGVGGYAPKAAVLPHVDSVQQAIADAPRRNPFLRTLGPAS